MASRHHKQLAMSGTLMVLNLVNPVQAMHSVAFVSTASMSMTAKSPLMSRSSWHLPLKAKHLYSLGSSPVSACRPQGLGCTWQRFLSGGRNPKDPLLSALRDFAEEEAQAATAKKKEPIKTAEKKDQGAGLSDLRIDEELREHLSDVDLHDPRIQEILTSDDQDAAESNPAQTDVVEEYLAKFRDANELPEDEEYHFEGPKRCGTVAIVGAPNAGKSTLLNRLIGSKVAIVTHKRQTTRNSIYGIAMEEGTQIVYIDTPGIMAPRPKERLNKALVKSAWNSARGADEIFFIVDVDKIIPGGSGKGRSGKPAMPIKHPVDPLSLRFREGSNENLIMQRLSGRGQKFNLILNKVDQLNSERRTLLIPMAEQLRRQAVVEGKGCMVERVFAVSAKSGKGLESLRTFVQSRMPQADWLYPPSQLSNIPTRVIASEITRESIFLRSHEEVPYCSFVDTTSFKEQLDGSVRLEQTIYVETEGQRRILIGMVKDLSMRSRREIGKFLGKEVHLFLTIRMKKGWTEGHKAFYNKMGLEFE